MRTGLTAQCGPLSSKFHAGNCLASMCAFKDYVAYSKAVSECLSKQLPPPLRDEELNHIGNHAYLQEAAERIDAGEPVPAKLEKIFDAGSSMGGARPKAVIEAESRQWLAKFGVPNDSFNMPCVEFATHKYVLLQWF